ncbi:MAG TPA: hypothetical protein VIY08_01730 [Candidatus Nitrosocosmicus sp.]
MLTEFYCIHMLALDTSERVIWTRANPTYRRFNNLIGFISYNRFNLIYHVANPLDSILQKFAYFLSICMLRSIDEHICRYSKSHP